MAEQTTAGATPAQQIAAGYATTGQALELGSVVVDGTVDPAARIRIPLATLNRHGLIAGATGTGKTKTLQVIAEQLSAAGVPVVMADVKGDLSGISKPGEAGDKTAARAKDTGDDWVPTGFPTEFVSLGTNGIGVPVRATIRSFGPILLSKVLGLNATQESTLGLIFHWADQQQLPLQDLKDLRAVITYLTSDEGKADLKNLGGVSAATAGVILRALINLEDQALQGHSATARSLYGACEGDACVADVSGLLDHVNLGDGPGSGLQSLVVHRLSLQPVQYFLDHQHHREDCGRKRRQRGDANQCPRDHGRVVAPVAQGVDLATEHH